MGCKCFARCEADCVCDHDWTPPAVIALREEVERLRTENADLRNANQILRDALDAERAELAGMVAQRTAYAREFPPDAEGEPDTGSIHANIRAMKAELAELRHFRKVITDYDSNLYDALADSDAARKGEEE